MSLPVHHEPFHLFGMGPRRRKLLFKDNALHDALTGETLHRWDGLYTKIEHAEYRVSLDTAGNERVLIYEDEEAVWLQVGRGDPQPLTRGDRASLPRFDGHPHAALLRGLHAELLVNVTPFGPVPNLWVYPRPWYRDSAMMLMAFERTGNLHLVEAWAAGLHKPFDRNNSGEAEADNLGQVLYIVSLFDGGVKHPIVEKALKEVQRFKRDRYILGRSDYAEHPVYQTKWLKFALRRLGLDDPYEVPEIADSYSALFWWDFKDRHVPGPRFDGHASRRYPYLSWAQAHFYGEDPPMDLLALGSPLTWEATASEAEYWRLSGLSRRYANDRVSAPHTWHAAEAFLYLHDQSSPAR